MTVEEIEILVTAKTEEAIKEIMKIIPAIKQATKQTQEAFSKVDTKEMKNKVQQAVQFIKEKIQDLKKSNVNNEIAIKVNNKEASKQISQVQKQIDSLQEKINARQMKLNIINPQIDKIVDDTRNNVVPDGISKNDKSMDTVVNNALSSNKDFTSLNSQAQKLYTEIEIYNKQLSEAKSKMTQLGQQTSQTATSQSKLGSFFSEFKKKTEQIKPTISSIGNSLKGLPKITQNITNNIKGMGSQLKSGLKHVIKYAGALISIRGIYGLLRGTANAWLSSQNAGAKQLSANIDYMKYTMGSALAPVIQFVTNLVYQLMRAIQSVVYALTGVNIFAKASAKSYASMAGSAKKAKEETKQLAGIHDEINNIQENNSNSGSGSGTTAPNFDLSGIDNQMSPLTQKLYDFFKPLKESWDKYGNDLIAQVKVTARQVGGLISSVWGSFEKIITNGTVYTTLELILAIIGNIAEAFANAWNYNGNGDVIVQNIANAFNNLLEAINNVIQSDGFQTWLNNCSDKFREISEKLASINWQPLINSLDQVGTSIGTLALDILSKLVDILKWFIEHPDVAKIILGIATAIKITIDTIKLIKTIGGIFEKLTSPIGLVVLAITVLIGIIILCIKHWDEIKETVTNVCNKMKETVSNWVKNIGEFFSNLKTNIVNKVTEIKDGIKNKFQEAYNGIKNIFSNIGNFFSNIWSRY